MRVAITVAVLACACSNRPPAVPAAPTRMPTLGDRIDDVLSRMVPFGLSGSVLVADSGGVILSKGYGPGLAPDTIYDMGSITKTFTATAIRMLEDEGKLSIDDPLSKHFDSVPADKASITLRQVLTHTAGLVNITGNDYDNVSREQLIADVLRAPLIATPGAEYNYSNAGFSLLAAIVEKVSGKSYHSFMRERLFAPAGMHDTGYVVRPGSERRVARTATPPVDHGTPWARLQSSGGIHWVLLGNGGMLTTVEDLYRWDLALRRGRIVSAGLGQKLFAPLFSRSATRSVASAWSRETLDGETILSHGSDAPALGVNGEYRRYLERHLTIIFLGNTRVNGWSPRRVVGPLVRRIIGGEMIDLPRVVPTEARQLASYAGTYTVSADSTIEIRVDGDHLVAGMSGQGAIDVFTLQREPEEVAVRRELATKARTVVSTFAWPEPPSDIRILGTTRRDRGALMTTFQTRSSNGTRTWRFAWQAPRGWAPGTGVGGFTAVSESDDGMLPQTGVFSASPIPFALERPLWRSTGKTFVFVDLYTQQSINVTFEPGAITVGASRFMRAS